MASKKYSPPRRETPALGFADPGAGKSENHGPSQFVIFRETIESLVVAFVLAFLFRTFEAEAFVIPTGSMSPSLQGRHKDVDCPQCGARFRTSASAEDMEDAGPRTQFENFHQAEVVGGMCPMCRYPMPYSSDLPREAAEEVADFANVDEIETEGNYPGDRILVNKYGYDYGEPARWDVIVFKFPGDGDMNYIKRLVGMPGEVLRVYQGDVFTRPLEDESAPFRIERKPPDKVAAMLQPVHDSDYESATLFKGGWPLRWAATTPNGWKVDAKPGDLTVAQSYTIDSAANSPVDAPLAWLRYRHQLPQGSETWTAAIAAAKSGSLAELAEQQGVSLAEAEESVQASIHPELITDFNSYNARIHRLDLMRGFRWSQTLERYQGMNWVGDLAVEANVDVEEARGELVLDLVEAGYHFQATIDLATGKATLGVIDGRTGKSLEFKDEAQSPLEGTGAYHVRFANIDDQLLLWVNGELVPFAHSEYDPDVLFAAGGGREKMIPWAADEGGDQGDLAPAGVGARGAKLAISRLAVLRDVYYIATDDTLARRSQDAMSADYESYRLTAEAGGQTIRGLTSPRELFAEREAWPRFLTRRKLEFPVKDEQLFVMGDNSPESADCRLWIGNGNPMVSRPGGRYLDRRLVIGKAVCVFWPHSWGGIPGLQRLPGFPNFGDMRMVR
jgi:signal peptidase I